MSSPTYHPPPRVGSRPPLKGYINLMFVHPENAAMNFFGGRDLGVVIHRGLS